MTLTRSNHINPCFWSALWNTDYFKEFMGCSESLGRPREQFLFFLEIHSNKIIRNKAKNIHYEKDLGIAEMTPEALLDFCKRNRPDQYDAFAREMQEHPDTFYLDFENIFTGMEELPMYRLLLDTIKKGRVDTLEEKTWLAIFLIHHQLRSHVYINKLTEDYALEGMEKFEALVKLRWSLEDARFMAPETNELISRQWTIYKIDRSILPLSDCPIIGSPSKTLFATLAPNMLLAVEFRYCSDLGIHYQDRIPPRVFNDYLRTTTEHVQKGLIFSDEKDAVKFREKVWWKKRRGKL